MRIKYSPVALFAYNRPNHFKSTLNALSKNFLALKTDIYVFCDGPKVETDIAKQTEIKEIVKRATGFKSITLIERGNNLGLAKSIVLGVTEIIHEYGSIIVLEDDIVTSPGFLTYMNDALDLYADDERVMHILAIYIL
jgi:GT2 family glycosyltransferase